MRPDRTAMASTLGRPRASVLHRCIRAAALFGALAFSSPLLAESPVDSRAYKLAPGDRIIVTVFGQDELSAESLLDGAGTIVLPVIGPLEVKDLTILECQKLIYDQLANGILKRPSVSVRISELRPLNILGDVRAPGSYPYRYGSTAQSAVAAAGGYGLAVPMPNAVSEFLQADERLHQLSFDKRALLIRRARLEAQRDGLNTFTPPSAPGSAQESEDLVAIEKETFDSQAALLRTQLDLLRSQKPRIQNEIDALNGQLATTRKQVELIKHHAEQYSGLVKQGLGLANAELQFKMTQANSESELWRLIGQLTRLQTTIGELDLKINEAETLFKKQVATELRDVRERLRELEVALPSAREIREVRLAQAGSLIGAAAAVRAITVTRNRNGEATVIPATETTPLEPGDIVDVKQVLPRGSLRQSASAWEPNQRPPQLEAATAAAPVGSVSR
jgi:polysaccharide export outer membrane protein